MSEGERDLLRAVGRGDARAFDALVRSTGPAVWALARRLTLDASTADDVTQEVFLATWRGAQGFRSESTARAWLFALTRRQAARTWRRRAGEPRAHDALDDHPLVALAGHAGFGADPERAAEHAEDRRALLAAIAMLHEADAALLTRCDLEGATVAEAAVELDIPPGTARVRLHRARLRLMATLHQGSSDD